MILNGLTSRALFVFSDVSVQLRPPYTALGILRRKAEKEICCFIDLPENQPNKTLKPPSELLFFTAVFCRNYGEFIILKIPNMQLSTYDFAYTSRISGLLNRSFQHFQQTFQHLTRQHQIRIVYIFYTPSKISSREITPEKSPRHRKEPDG